MINMSNLQGELLQQLTNIEEMNDSPSTEESVIIVDSIDTEVTSSNIESGDTIVIEQPFELPVDNNSQHVNVNDIFSEAFSHMDSITNGGSFNMNVDMSTLPEVLPVQLSLPDPVVLTSNSSTLDIVRAQAVVSEIPVDPNHDSQGPSGHKVQQ